MPEGDHSVAANVALSYDLHTFQGNHDPFGMSKPIRKAPSSRTAPSAMMRIPFFGPAPDQDDRGTLPFEDRALPAMK